MKKQVFQRSIVFKKLIQKILQTRKTRHNNTVAKLLSIRGEIEMGDIRQIPTNERFNKKTIDDLLYGYFQMMSYLGIDKEGNKVRFVYRNHFTNEDLAATLDVSVSQARRKVKILKDAGFIAEDQVWNAAKTELCKVFVLTEYSNEIQYIQVDTLEKLVDTTNKNVIKVYAYLLGWHGFKKRSNSKFIFTKKQLIEYCFGMSSTTNQRDYKAINNILECLVLFGLIEYKNIYCTSPEGHLHLRMELTKVNEKVKAVVIEKSNYRNEL